MKDTMWRAFKGKWMITQQAALVYPTETPLSWFLQSSCVRLFKLKTAKSCRLNRGSPKMAIQTRMFLWLCQALSHRAKKKKKTSQPFIMKENLKPEYLKQLCSYNWPPIRLHVLVTYPLTQRTSYVCPVLTCIIMQSGGPCQNALFNSVTADWKRLCFWGSLGGLFDQITPDYYCRCHRVPAARALMQTDRRRACPHRFCS